MRMRKKPNLPQRFERCADVLITSPADCRGRWLEYCPGYNELRLEIGCGKGRFLTETAVAEPDVLFIGLERVPEAMVIAMERAMNAGLKNVRYIDADAVRLPELFGPGEASRIYLNFSDPWPKKGHAKRRLTYESFLENYRSILKPGGEIHIKTDNAPLFDFSLEQLTQCGYELADMTRDLHKNGPNGVMTDYELKFYEQGVSIHRCVARLK